MQKTFTLIPPHTLKPGAVVFFRAAGMREFTPVTVLPRGPRGQFMVEFHGSPLAVSEGKELFEVAS